MIASHEEENAMSSDNAQALIADFFAKYHPDVGRSICWWEEEPSDGNDITQAARDSDLDGLEEEELMEIEER
jgi:hypothetical protein